MERHLTSTTQVIDALGGTDAVVGITGRCSNAVSNWRVKDKFPASTYLLINDKLRGLGLTANVGLWGFDREPKRFKRALVEATGATFPHQHEPRPSEANGEAA